MISISFHPESDILDFSKACKEYENIWESDGRRIIEVWEKLTGLTFKEGKINAIVFKGISHSVPLSLRYDLDFDRKKAILVHELGHRILSNRVTQIENSSLENHKTLFLILFDVLMELYGKDFTNSTIEWDKKLPREEYRLAWEWALSFNDSDRKGEFKKRLK